ncbi:TonB-dependent receptor [Pedobacter gandavensis]|uniref:TonB-dependent siderophore receptor n=1 Tax=Pedobacter gandavensis TaxID=2679963 RepID=A0ABR6F252_9SPHI|nr:TonB-dependent receptor [Pedobacter gandavensis]MBB2151526.1 TonB-dependent siderophore receptor [Pedobacter gandavensis]
MKRLYILLSITLLTLFTNTTFAQLASAPVRGAITGKVTTSDGKPAAFVNLQIVENGKKSLSNEDGTFRFNNLKGGTYTVKCSYVGLKIQSQKVTVIEGQTATVDFTLPESAADLDEVVISSYKSENLKPVSAGKIAIKPMDLPQSVTVIGKEVIRDQQANRLSDVLKNVNGIALGSTRGTTGDNFFARGYSLGANNYFKNGARSNSGALPEASTLESVEVLKGSAALLYGNVSSGAIVNMVTKKPKFEYGGEVSMRAGSYDLYKPTGDIYGPITKDLAFRVIGTYENARSYRNSVKSDRVYVNPSLLYNISKKTSLLVQGDYLDYDLTPDFGIGSVGGKIPTNIPRSAFFNTAWAYNKGKQGTASAELNHQFNDNWKLNAVGSYQSFNRNYFSSERIQAADNGDLDRKLTRSKTAEDYYTGQVNLNGFFKTGTIKHTLLVGVDGDRYLNLVNQFDLNTSAVYDRINTLDPSKFTPRTDMPATNITGSTKTPTDRVGAYFQDLIAVSEKVKVLAGLRYSYQAIAAPDVYTVATGETVKSPTVKSRYDQAFSPRVGLVYQPYKTTSLFASYSNNFAPNNGIDINGANLKASIIDQYEVGVKNDLFNGKMTANVSVYKIINHDFVQSVAGSTVFKEFAGQTTSDGVEVDLSGTIVEGLNFLAGYSYNFMRYTKTSGLPTGNIVGERLVGNTAHTANGTLFYTFSEGAIKGLKLGASGFYTGKRYAGWNNTPADLASATGSRLIPVKGFTTFDFTAGYSFKKLSILGKVSNIGNTLNYYVHENYSINPIPPRQFMTTVSYRF